MRKGQVALEGIAMGAAALLYKQTEDGDLQMVGTATAFEKTASVVRFVSAAHCVAEDNEEQERVKVEDESWFITMDEPGSKNFMRANLVGVGYQLKGDDFAVLEVDAKMLPDCKVIPLATEATEIGEEIINIASPEGLGKQLFRGHVSMLELDRPLKAETLNWKGAMLVQITVAPGSSGSAIVSVRQRSIIAFLVGVYGKRMASVAITIPVGRFIKFWKQVQNKKYPYYKCNL